jgi:hypothetical protein
VSRSRYTNFSYSELRAPASAAPCDGLNLTVAVANTGAMLSAETVRHKYPDRSSELTELSIPF